ncbi:hypothetical protein [Luteibacter sp. 3190]|uniref:hypothetical protein n=1 Tax=Luteibacter sp. 3190 TaxID=2817736 RepID=UPI002859BC94|nr:hypothetical protein [Luteibacter sp. 3190]MDR6935726.1 hypothetical protein [Luteibacter sp. 3190]
MVKTRIRRNTVLLVLALVVENVVVAVFGSSLVASNIAFVAALVYFNLSLSPEASLGFALTIRDWGDVWRREKQGDYDPDGPEFARAAVRSLTILSAVVLFGFCMEFLRRSGNSFATTVSVMSGIEAGFVAGYLVATRNRPRKESMNGYFE